MSGGGGEEEQEQYLVGRGAPGPLLLRLLPAGDRDLEPGDRDLRREYLSGLERLLLLLEAPPLLLLLRGEECREAEGEGEGIAV